MDRQVVETLNQIRHCLVELSDKETYKGKTGVWRTAKNGDHIFFPDDGSPPMAMRKYTKKPPEPSADVKKKSKLTVGKLAKQAKGGSLKDPEHRKKVGGMISRLLKRKKKAAIEFAKKEIAEIKHAGPALVKMVKGTKWKDLDHHDQEALKATAKAVAMTVAGTVGFSVGGAALGGAVGASAVKAGIGKVGAMALAKHFALEAMAKSAIAGLVAHQLGKGAPIVEAEDEAISKALTDIMNHIEKRFASLGDMSADEIEKILSGD